MDTNSNQEEKKYGNEQKGSKRMKQQDNNPPLGSTNTTIPDFVKRFWNNQLKEYQEKVEIYKKSQSAYGKISFLFACKLEIGPWKRDAKYNDKIWANFYHGKEEFVWEVTYEGRLRGMQLKWNEVKLFKGIFTRGQPDTLHIQLMQPPVCKDCDFTGGQAAIHSTHRITFAEGSLNECFERLMCTNYKLYVLHNFGNSPDPNSQYQASMNAVTSTTTSQQVAGTSTNTSNPAQLTYKDRAILDKLSDLIKKDDSLLEPGNKIEEVIDKIFEEFLRLHFEKLKCTDYKFYVKKHDQNPPESQPHFSISVFTNAVTNATTSQQVSGTSTNTINPAQLTDTDHDILDELEDIMAKGDFELEPADKIMEEFVKLLEEQE